MGRTNLNRKWRWHTTFTGGRHRSLKKEVSYRMIAQKWEKPLKRLTKLVIKGHLRWIGLQRAGTVIQYCWPLSRCWSHLSSAVTERSFSRKWPFYIFPLFKYVHSKILPTSRKAIAMQKTWYLNDKCFENVPSLFGSLSFELLYPWVMQMQAYLLSSNWN